MPCGALDHDRHGGTACPQSAVQIGPHDQRRDRFQLRWLRQLSHPLGVAEIAPADHVDGAVRARQGSGPPYGVAPVALLVRPRLPLPFVANRPRVSWMTTMKPRLAAASGSSTTVIMGVCLPYSSRLRSTGRGPVPPDC
jgi:hypothetical protein